MYNDTLDVLKELSNEQAGELFKAIAEYANQITEKQKEAKKPIGLSPVVSAIFTIISAQMLRDFDKYEDICKARSKAGAKGGRPPKKQKKQIKAKKADSDTDSDTDIKEGAEKSAPKYSDEDMEVARYWGNKVKVMSPSFILKPEHGPAWADIVRKMITIDGRTHDYIKQYIDAVSNDSFWNGNFSDIKKLRKHINDGKLDKLVKKTIEDKRWYL